MGGTIKVRRETAGCGGAEADRAGSRGPGSRGGAAGGRAAVAVTHIVAVRRDVVHRPRRPATRLGGHVGELTRDGVGPEIHIHADVAADQAAGDGVVATG